MSVFKSIIGSGVSYTHTSEEKRNVVMTNNLSLALAAILGMLVIARFTVLIPDAPMIARIDGRRIRLSAAGMPPALVYRAASGEVEEVVLKGMPLGAFLDFRYEERELELAAGDVVLLMSDGLPELFNAEREMFDYPRAVTAFRDVATGSASEIVDGLRRRADEWADGRPQDDDITFVAIKVRS